MRQFVLTEDLLTSVEDIDEDHRTIVNVANKTLELGFENKNRPVFEETISFLNAYVIFHFFAEEQLMGDIAYPHLEHHRKFHENFYREISEHANRVRMDGISRELMVKISFTIENWLSEHLRIVDGALSKYIRQHHIPAKLPDVHTLKRLGKLPADFDEGIVRGKSI
jgi:hemerythrin